MKVSLMLRGRNGGDLDVTALTEEIVWEGRMTGQPGKLSFALLAAEGVAFEEGAPVELTVDGKDRFSGYVFARSRRDARRMTVTAYDQLRYFKNRDTYVLADMSCSEIFAKVCGDFGLKHSVVHASAHVLPPKVYDDRTIGDIVQDAIDLTLAETGRRFFVRDDFGTLEHLDVAELATDLVIGDGSLMTGSLYETAIDKDSFSVVKLSRESRREEKRGMALARDEANTERWGVLQYYEKVKEGINDAQMRARAEALLAQKSRVTKTLVLDALGDWRALPGCGVWVESQQMDERLSREMRVLAATHTLKNELHTMRLTMEAV